MKLSIKDSVYHERTGVKGWYYQLPEINNGTSVIYGEITGEHGERHVGNHPRIYYIIDGVGEYEINGEKINVEKGDVVVIPPKVTYNYWAKSAVLKILLTMDLLDLSLLPK
jgi:quercetin dioxygenase-like cupin family protein